MKQGEIEEIITIPIPTKVPDTMPESVPSSPASPASPDPVKTPERVPA